MIIRRFRQIRIIKRIKRIKKTERIERLESIEEIRQLAAKYALALDMRNLDALAALFCEDVRVGKNQSGRGALKKWFDETLRNQFTGTAHVTGNHIIEFQGTNHAVGTVYSRNEHETPAEWVAMTMMYWDTYERKDKSSPWLFRRRLPIYWYAADMRRPPLGKNKMRWPDQDPYEGIWEEFWPSWREFWESPPAEAENGIAEPIDVSNFLEYMRGSNAKEIPKVRVR